VAVVFNHSHSNKRCNLRSFLCNELEPFAYLIYSLAVLLQLKHNKSFGYKVLSVFYTVSAVTLYIGIVFSDNNSWTYNIIFFVNIVLLSWYYFNLFNTKTKRTITIVLGALNAAIFIFINVVQHKYNDYNAEVYGFSFITIVLYSFLYLHQLLVGMKEESLLRNFDFWLVCGFLFYFLGSFVIVLYYNHSNDYSGRGDMWLMHNIILFISSVFTLLVSLQISKRNNLRHV
jgi:hypothetical protein